MKDYKKKYEQAIERAKAVNPGTTDYNIVTKIFPELKESDDERIRKYLMNYVKSAGVGHSLFDSVNTRENILAWLEKQGEQKLIDKVKPKFHEGEWVQIVRGNVMKILEVEEEIPCYKILNYYGGESIRKISDIDSIAHSWTIQDTKAGDVLADNYGIYIFEKFDECDKNCFVCNGAYQYSEKVFECEHMLCSTDVHPATKEQRNQLEKAMVNAGYRWNKEELKLEKKCFTGKRKSAGGFIWKKEL